MAKLPYIPIYPGDWERDANCLKAYAEFALFKLTVKLNDAKNKGVYVADFDTLSTLFKCDIPTAERSIKDLTKTDTLDIEYLENGFVEIKSRRILKEKAISDARSAAGKIGGKTPKKIIKKQNKIKKETKHNQIPEDEIEYDNVIYIENKEKKGVEKKYVRDASLEKSIMDFFGFTQIRNPDKESLIFQFCTALHNSSQLENFKSQFVSYSEYKALAGFKHSFSKFIGEQSDLFLNGAWNSENWAMKLAEEKNKPSQPEKNGFPNVWDRTLFDSLRADKQQQYINHLKGKIKGKFKYTGTGYPSWDYDDTDSISVSKSLANSFSK